MVFMTGSTRGHTPLVVVACLAVAVSLLPKKDTGGPVPNVSSSASPSADVQQHQQSEKGRPPVSRKVKIVIEGDSLSVRGARGKTVFTWSDQIYEKFGQRYLFAFHATAGDRLAGQISKQIFQITAEFDEKSSSNIVILYAGVNDLYIGEKGQKVYEAALRVAGAYKKRGFRVWIATVPPARKVSDVEREKYNALLKTAQSPPWEKVIDFAAIPQFRGPANEVTQNREIYSLSLIHI